MDCSSPYAMASLVGLKDQYARRLRQRSRRRPPRHRHAVGRPDEPEPLSSPSPSAICSRTGPHWPAAAAVGKTLVSQQPDRPRRRAASAASSAKCPSASNGSRPACSTAPAASAARKAPGPASCAATARVWTTDKDGLILGLLAAEITAVHRQGPRRALPGTDRRSSASSHYTRIDAPATPEQKKKLANLSPEAVTAAGTGRRADHRQAHRSPRQRRAHRRPESHHRQRLVRRPPLRHRKHLQDLRRKLPGRRPPQANPRRSPTNRQRRAEIDYSCRSASIGSIWAAR